MRVGAAPAAKNGPPALPLVSSLAAGKKKGAGFLVFGAPERVLPVEYSGCVKAGRVTYRGEDLEALAGSRVLYASSTGTQVLADPAKALEREDAIARALEGTCPVFSSAYFSEAGMVALGGPVRAFIFPLAAERYSGPGGVVSDALVGSGAREVSCEGSDALTALDAYLRLPLCGNSRRNPGILQKG